MKHCPRMAKRVVLERIMGSTPRRLNQASLSALIWHRIFPRLLQRGSSARMLLWLAVITMQLPTG